jgi:integral membrane protein (TIGR01906 family)
MARSLKSLLTWIVALLVPLALLGCGVRLLLTHAFLEVEYHLPNFPTDEYGFTTADRVRWGAYGIDYLLNTADISFLGDLALPGGTPLFNERELSHMQDVKSVTQSILRVWYAILAVIAGLALWAWTGNWWKTFRGALRRGAQVTLGLAIAVGLVGTVGATGSGDLFWQFFSDFHGLFFRGNTWLFSFSDSLIRLYPIRFWQDAVLYIGLLAALGAVLLLILTGRTSQPGPAPR